MFLVSFTSVPPWRAFLNPNYTTFGFGFIRVDGLAAVFLHKIFLATENITRYLGSLSKLARHLENPIVITGSVATSLHLLNKGVRRKKRIDLFTPNSRTLSERVADFIIGDLSCKAVSIEDVLAKLLSITHSVTRGEAVDPKYVEDLHLLSSAADLDMARKIWRDYRKEGQPITFDEAAEAVRHSILTHPDLLQAEIYSQDVYLKCQWCHESELFPLAPRSKVYEILGYI